MRALLLAVLTAMVVLVGCRGEKPGSRGAGSSTPDAGCDRARYGDRFCDSLKETVESIRQVGGALENEASREEAAWVSELMDGTPGSAGAPSWAFYLVLALAAGIAAVVITKKKAWGKVGASVGAPVFALVGLLVALIVSSKLVEWPPSLHPTDFDWWWWLIFVGWIAATIMPGKDWGYAGATVVLALINPAGAPTWWWWLVAGFGLANWLLPHVKYFQGRKPLLWAILAVAVYLLGAASTGSSF